MRTAKFVSEINWPLGSNPSFDWIRNEMYVGLTFSNYFMFCFWRSLKPKSHKPSTSNTNCNGICDEQFSIKMHWEIQNNLVCRYNLEIHFDFHSSITRSVWWSCRHYLARFYTVTTSSFTTKFQSWFDFSLFTFFLFDKISPTDWRYWRRVNCLTLCS